MSKRFFSYILYVIFISLFNFHIANACSCGQTPPVLDSFENSAQVVIVRVLSLDKSKDESKFEGYGGINSTKTIIEKVYKGNVKVGDEMIFAQGGGSDCVWTFSDKDINKEFLFYLDSSDKGSKIWVAYGCNRSNFLEYAGDDLLYLNKIEKVRGKTRISGKVEFQEDDLMSVKGITIRIIGSSKNYKAITDQNGVYEIYDLAPGKYLIEPDIPDGWRVDFFWFNYSPSIDIKRKVHKPEQIPIILKNRRHASLDFHFEIDNAFSGKIISPDGKPMRNVCVTATPINNNNQGSRKFDYTNEDGKFKITQLPKGSYILVINEEGKLSSRQPFSTFYYPNVFEKDKADILLIGTGNHIENLDIVAPQSVETITIEGRFLYADGKPVDDGFVQFKADKSSSDINGDDHIDIDESGRYSIKVLKGVKGKLYGFKYSFVGEYENCPQIDELVRKAGGSVPEIKTEVLEIDSEKDLENVELKYPFTSCKKAKIR